jgi:hypothetical protein
MRIKSSGTPVPAPHRCCDGRGSFTALIKPGLVRILRPEPPNGLRAGRAGPGPGPHSKGTSEPSSDMRFSTWADALPWIPPGIHYVN